MKIVNRFLILKIVSFYPRIKNVIIIIICNIERKTPVSESLFNKVASLDVCNFIKRRLQYRCFLVNIAKLLWKFYLKNTTGGCFCTLNSLGIWWHVNREIDDIYFQYNTLCLYYVFLHLFALSFAEFSKTR